MELRTILLLFLALAIGTPGAMRAAEEQNKDLHERALYGEVDWNLLLPKSDLPGMPSLDLASVLGDDDAVVGIVGFPYTPDPVIGQAAADSCAAELAALPPATAGRADEFLSVVPLAVPTSGAGTAASAAPAQARRYGKCVVEPSTNKRSATASADDDAEVGVDEKCSDVAVPKKHRAFAAAASVANACPICSQSFRSLRALQQHAEECDAFGDHAEVSASDVVALPVSALITGKTPSVEAHATAIPSAQATATAEAGERPYKCDKCEKSFAWPTILKRHQYTHTGERPYKCDVCNKTFTRATQLTIHQRTHTGERPYKCDECDKAFGDPSALTVHQRTHTGERPYKCDKCDKAFGNPSNLIHHQHTHTRVKPYECEDDDTHSTFNPDDTL